MRQQLPTTHIIRALQRENRALKQQVARQRNQSKPTVPKYLGGPLDVDTSFPFDPVSGQQAHADGVAWHYADGEWRTGLHLINQGILAEAADTIDITDIPAVFGSLLLKLETLTTESAFVVDAYDFYGAFALTFNDDDGHNYSYREANKDVYSEFDGDEFILFPCTVDSDGGSLAAYEIKVSSYQESARATVQGRGVLTGLASGSNRVPIDMCGSWLDTSLITKITLSAFGNFVAGTQWRLFGHGQARPA